MKIVLKELSNYKHLSKYFENFYPLNKNKFLLKNFLN